MKNGASRKRPRTRSRPHRERLANRPVTPRDSPPTRPKPRGGHRAAANGIAMSSGRQADRWAIASLHARAPPSGDVTGLHRRRSTRACRDTTGGFCKSLAFDQVTDASEPAAAVSRRESHQRCDRDRGATVDERAREAARIVEITETCGPAREGDTRCERRHAGCRR